MKSSSFRLFFTHTFMGYVLFTISCMPNHSLDQKKDGHMQIARLSQGDTQAFQAIRQSFSHRNPGYDMMYEKDIQLLP